MVSRTVERALAPKSGVSRSVWRIGIVGIDLDIGCEKQEMQGRQDKVRKARYIYITKNVYVRVCTCQSQL